jgi:hypothetical protein
MNVTYIHTDRYRERGGFICPDKEREAEFSLQIYKQRKTEKERKGI